MSGFFKTNREIFSHPIWHNILQFRLFFLIYGKAVHSKEGFRQTETLTLKRGQWQRSYDKLIDDLKYKENNTWKKYSKTTLQRNIKVMELNGLLSTSQHELGTIFTVVNYEKYQGFQEFSKSDLEQDLEQQRNSNGTATEQQRNHNNNDNKENKEKKEKKEDNINNGLELISIEEEKKGYTETIYLTEKQYQKIVKDYEGELDFIESEFKNATLWMLEPTNLKKWKNKDINLFIRRWMNKTFKDYLYKKEIRNKNKNNSQSKIEMANAGRSHNIQNTLFLDGGL